MSTVNKNNKIFRGVMVCILVLLVSILFSILFMWVQTGDLFTLSTIVFGIVFFLNFIILGWIGYKIFSSTLNKSSAQIKKRFIHTFILFVLLAFVVSFSIVSLGNYVLYLTGGLETDNLIRHLFYIVLPNTIKEFSIWILVTAVFLFYTIWRKAIEKELLLEEENLKYRYRTLKTQVNPHFLFNSLNTLSEIVYVDAKKADNYIQKLSRIYRYILDNEETDLILLNKEIEFVRHYFDLHKERNDNKIQLYIDIENADKLKIVPISLQILVENALKHNVISEENPLKIHINSDDEYILVSNNIQRKGTLSNFPGTGLSNLKERVKLITGKEVIINEENNQFIVKLPFVGI